MENEAEVLESVPKEKLSSFVKELNKCVLIFEGGKFRNSSLTKFSKKVRKVISKYFNVSLGEVKDISISREGSDILVKYPYGDSEITLIRFEVSDL